MAQHKKIIDGAAAATYIAYAMSEVASIYPISPIAEMGELADKWAANGVKNLFGQPMVVRELESELGAAGAIHGAAAGGAYPTTFTCSQGLLLMIPNMYKMAGGLLPAVFHVGARTVATHALSIYGDHSDVMACRATGFAMMASSSVQENHDLAIVAHLAAMESSLPMLHFFDAYRTANEIQTVDVVDYEDLRPLMPWDKIAAFRKRAMNPEHSDLRGSAQNPDIYFQNREACNKYYDALPAIVQAQMDKVANITGRQYHLFDYVGHPEAEYVTVSMGSSCDVMDETVRYLNSVGYKVGHIKVRLYRPFAAEAFIAALPSTVKAIAALDRDKEPGAVGEPLFTDVCTALFEAGKSIKVIGGRYGLSSKDFNAGMGKAIFDELAKPNPKNRFTIGIIDDVTNLSLDYDHTLDPIVTDTKQVTFYGIGNDGTVGATKQAARIIGSDTDYHVQAHFEYSAKKSGGYTISQLRFAMHPIKAAYDIVEADYVGCNKATYVGRFPMLDNIREGGIFVLNSLWTQEQMDTTIPPTVKRQIASKKLRFYNVNAIAIAHKHGLGEHINVVMEAAFFKLMCGSQLNLDLDAAIASLKQQVAEMYGHEGQNVIEANNAAIDDALNAITEINYPASWADIPVSDELAAREAYLSTMPKWVREVAIPMLEMKGGKLPVSKMTADGVFPAGESAYEKRRIAEFVPEWDPQKCIECTECSFVCSHAAIRPFVATADEMKTAPASYITKDAWAKPLAGMKWRIQIYPDDCTGCASCSTVCPAGALPMVAVGKVRETELANLDFARNHVTSKSGLLPRFSIPGSQLYTPLLEFSGACGGCGETPYVKLLTQLFGEHIVIANATGCSSVWGADAPSMVYCRNEHGLGPAWGNSLFEDNAEYGYGIALAITQRRNRLIDLAQQAVADSATDPTLKSALQSWLEVKDDYEKSYNAGLDVKQFIARNPSAKYADEIGAMTDLLGRKSVWAVGGDGWAYDIGFAGVDHVLASGTDINMLVLDTQCYSNTGGQTSKATPYGACTKYNYDGKRQFSKNLGQMMMTYRNVYVASVAIGGNMNQVVEALKEAEAYPGPSIVIAYCPCLMHGIKESMSHSVIQQRKAVENNMWPIYRFNPAKGENALQFDQPWDYPLSPAMPAPPKWSPKPWVKENIIAFGASAPRNGADNPLIVDSDIEPPQSVDTIVTDETRFTELPTRTSAAEAQEIFQRLQDASQENVNRLKQQPS